MVDNSSCLSYPKGWLLPSRAVKTLVAFSTVSRMLGLASYIQVLTFIRHSHSLAWTV